MEGHIVQAENIVKYFGEKEEKRAVLDNVDIAIEKGEFVTVMGLSGSGKSTLMFALSGMDDVDSGRIVFDGQDISKLKENESADMRRRNMGFVFQQPTMLKNLNILDNIILPSLRDNRRNRDAIVAKATTMMKKMNIDHLAARDIAQVSGGELQRAGICRALMSSPDIIFGDEPTGALNSKTAQDIMCIFSDIHAAGTAILLVTHDANVAAQAGRTLFMRDGKIVGELLPEGNVDDRKALILDRMQQLGI